MSHPAELPGVCFCHFCVSSFTPCVAFMITSKCPSHGFKILRFISHQSERLQNRNPKVFCVDGRESGHTSINDHRFESVPFEPSSDSGQTIVHASVRPFVNDKRIPLYSNLAYFLEVLPHALVDFPMSLYLLSR